jgi:uncharacterized membrane protein
MTTVTEFILWILMGIGEIGAAIALYGRYRTLPAFLTGPNVCKLEAGGCQVLFRTPNAALLGVPNSLLAVLYYPLLALGLTRPWPLPLLLAASTFAFGMTVYLAWVLLRDKLECRVCWMGHLCNTVIWLILLERFLHVL